MKVLITGGTGFIGTHLNEFLNSNCYSTRIFDINGNSQFYDVDFTGWDLIIGDVSNYVEVMHAAEKCDVIVHLASALGTDYLINQPHFTVQSNIIGTLNVLDVAKATGAKVIYLSLLPDWNNPYMITKNAASKFCQMYFTEFGVKTIVLRGTHIYGERQKSAPVRKAVPNFVLAALKNKPIQIYGSGDQLMDLLYVKDTVKAIVSAINTPLAIGQAIELGSGVGISVITLARKIITLCDSSSTIEFIGPRPGEPSSLKSFIPANTQNQSSILGFVPQTSLDQGLIQTINWYRDLLSKNGGKYACFT